MELAIAGATTVAVLFWIATIIAGAKQRESWLIWTVYFAMVFSGLVFFLNWQKRVWESPKPSKGAYVFVKAAALKKPLASGESPVVQVVFRNNGPMEARVKLWACNVFPEGPPFKQSFEYVAYKPNSFLLAPGDEVEAEVEGDFIIGKEQLDALQNNGIRLYFFAPAEYRDEAGRVYPLAFCRMWNKKTTGNLIFCPNDVVFTEKIPGKSRGYISIHDITQPDNLAADQEVTAYVTWANEGDNPAEITYGVVELFISKKRPSEAIPCDYTGGGVPPVIVLGHGSHTHRFSAKPNTFTVEQIDGVNGTTKTRHYFGLCGLVHYTTLGQVDSFKFCRYYDPDKQTYVDCEKE